MKSNKAIPAGLLVVLIACVLLFAWSFFSQRSQDLDVGPIPEAYVSDPGQAGGIDPVLPSEPESVVPELPATPVEQRRRETKAWLKPNISGVRELFRGKVKLSDDQIAELVFIDTAAWRLSDYNYVSEVFRDRVIPLEKIELVAQMRSELFRQLKQALVEHRKKGDSEKEQWKTIRFMSDRFLAKCREVLELSESDMDALFSHKDFGEGNKNPWDEHLYLILTKESE